MHERDHRFAQRRPVISAWLSIAMLVGAAARLGAAPQRADEAPADAVVVTVSEPMSLSIPEYVDTVVGPALGRTVRSSAARVKLAQLALVFDPALAGPTCIALMPTGTIRASGRLAGSTVLGNAVVTRVDNTDAAASPLSAITLAIGRRVAIGIDLDLHMQRTPATQAADLRFRMTRGVPLLVGWSLDQRRSAAQTALDERRVHVTYRRAGAFSVQPQLCVRRDAAGARRRWLDCAVVVERDWLQGPVLLALRHQGAGNVVGISQSLPVAGGLQVSWLIEQERRDGAGRSNHAVGLGTALRTGGALLCRLRWRRDRPTDRNTVRLEVSRTWSLGPLRLGGVDAAYRELGAGRWELRLGGMVGVPITLERRADGGLYHHWSR